MIMCWYLRELNFLLSTIFFLKPFFFWKKLYFHLKSFFGFEKPKTSLILLLKYSFTSFNLLLSFFWVSFELLSTSLSFMGCRLVLYSVKRPLHLSSKCYPGMMCTLTELLKFYHRGLHAIYNTILQDYTNGWYSIVQPDTSPRNLVYK